MIDYPDGFSNEWRDYKMKLTYDKTTEAIVNQINEKMTYDKATDPDAGLKLDEIRDAVFDSEEAFTLDFTSKPREGFTSSTDHAMRHEMQRMANKINELEKRINELEKPIEDYLK